MVDSVRDNKSVWLEMMKDVSSASRFPRALQPIERWLDYLRFDNKT